jgi:hypothetical protein
MADNYLRSFTGLNVTNSRIDGLMADFSGLKSLEKIVSDKLNSLVAQPDTQFRIGMVGRGSMSRQDFDGWFSELIRKELGKTLGIIRNKAIQKARIVGAGSASTAVLRRMYKDEFGGNINIASPRGRISNRRRLYEPGTKKPRHVGDRTKKTNEYYGPDRGFILRFLEFGTDVRTAKTFGPTGKGSTASWGARGNIQPRSFFHTMGSDMEQAAQQLGQTLAGSVEEFIEKAFKEAEE